MFKTQVFEEQVKEWEELLKKIILTNIPREVKVEANPKHPLAKPIANNPNQMIDYFLKGHRPKILKSVELIDKHLKDGKIGISVGSWISAIGLFFHLKYGMFVESISIDCDDWILENVARNYRKNLCKVDTLGKEKYDLIIEAEMFGHYPCSEVKCAKMIIDACKINGIIHFSVPLGNNGRGLSKDAVVADIDVDGCYSEHFRHYQKDEIIEIIKSLAPECELLENEIVNTPAFGNIQITVWKKK